MEQNPYDWLKQIKRVFIPKKQDSDIMKKSKQKPSALRQSNFWVALIILLPLVLTACNKRRPSSKVNDISQDTLVPNTDINKPVSVAKIGVAQVERFGQYLTDAEGRALYMFTGDTDTASSCYANCAKVWPPLLTTGEIKAVAPAVKESLFGTIQRRDSSLQVTYNGRPLYYFKKDTTAGKISGQDVNGFGGDWYLMAPDGNHIEEDSTENPKVRD